MRPDPKNPFAAPQFGGRTDCPGADSLFAGGDDFSDLLADLDSIEQRVVGDGQPSDSPACDTAPAPNGFKAITSPLESMLRSSGHLEEQQAGTETEGSDPSMTALVSDHLSKLLEGTFDNLATEDAKDVREEDESSSDESNGGESDCGEGEGEGEGSREAMAEVWRGMRQQSPTSEPADSRQPADEWRNFVHKGDMDPDEEYDFAPAPLREVDRRSAAKGDLMAQERDRRSRDADRAHKAAAAASQAQLELRERRKNSFLGRSLEAVIPETNPLALTRCVGPLASSRFADSSALRFADV
jgi:hypothetical protein